MSASGSLCLLAAANRARRATLARSLSRDGSSKRLKLSSSQREASVLTPSLYTTTRTILPPRRLSQQSWAAGGGGIQGPIALAGRSVALSGCHHLPYP